MTAQTSCGRLSRRSLLTSGLAGRFLLALHLAVRAVKKTVHMQSDDAVGKFAPHAFIRIDHSGKTNLVMPQVEMGQGVYTSIPMILAEELDADFSQFVLEHAPPSDALYANPILRYQVTGNSNSIRPWWKPLRTAGASARAMLVRAAALEWNVEPIDCMTANGEVIHKESRRKLPYGALVDAANLQIPPKDVPIKNPNDFVLIGKPLKRLDTPDKVNGKVVYGIDVMLPGMKFATLKACPVLGGKLVAVDDRAAGKIPGVRQVAVLEDLVAVVGDHVWAAKKGIEALIVDWDEGPNAAVDQDGIWRDIGSASEKDGVVAKTRGDIGEGLFIGERHEASYELPFLAHATMEPVNATVRLKPDSCEVWTGTQALARVKADAAKAAGLPVEKVIARDHMLGGRFGRKLETDMVTSAVRIAKHVDGPVKVVWTREEDIQHDFYRPAYHDTIIATESGGKISSWKYRISGPAIFARGLPTAFRNGIDNDAVDSVAQLEGDLTFGPTAALHGEITLAKGRVKQSNFNDYRMLRIDQTPKIDVQPIKSGEPPGGIGETGVTAGPRHCAMRFLPRRAALCGGCR